MATVSLKLLVLKALGLEQAVNTAINARIMDMHEVYYIETGPALMSDGQPDRDNYIFDGLHLSDAGYAIWTDIIRSRLLDDLGRGPN